jgi:hypothetical protein
MSDTQKSIVVEGTRGKVRAYEFTEDDDYFDSNLRIVRDALRGLEDAHNRVRVKHLLGASGILVGYTAKEATVIEILSDGNLLVYAGEFGEFEVFPEEFVPGSDPVILPVPNCDPDGLDRDITYG